MIALTGNLMTQVTPPVYEAFELIKKDFKPDESLWLLQEIQEQIKEEEFNGLYTYADVDNAITGLSTTDRLSLLKILEDYITVWIKGNYDKAKKSLRRKS